MAENFEALIEAVKENSLTAVQEILSDKDVNFDINQITGPWMERTILHVAVLIKTIDVGIVELLLCNNAKVNVQDDAKCTPLHYAVHLNRIDVVELLLKHGADLNNYVDLYNCTPWHACFETGNLLLMNLMLKYQTGVNFKDSHGRNALHLAAERGTYEMIESLIRMGMNVNEKCAFYYETPLHIVLNNYKDNAEDRIRKIHLLVDSGADVNAVDVQNNNPLCWAARIRGEVNAFEIINCLLELGANPNIHGYESPLWHAAFNHDVEAVELLLRYGANVHFMRGSLTLMNAMTIFFYGRGIMEDRVLYIAKLLLIRGVTLEENYDDDDHMFLFDLIQLLKDCQSEYNHLKITRIYETCPLTYGDLLVARNESLVRYLRREDFRTAIKSAIDNKNFVKYFSDDLKKKCTSGFELIKMLDDLVDLLDEVFETVLPHDVIVLISQYFNEDDLKNFFDGNQEHL